MRGFGHDGRGEAITGETPFPIGSLTKSFTAVLVRQAIEAGQLDADGPVQRYLPWFRVADAEASSCITLRPLLNQTSGLSRADGIAPLLQGSRASIEELARGMGAISLNRPVGESFEYGNLNYMLLGAVLQAVTGQSWDALVRERVMRPLATTHSHTDHDSARRDGMTALHRMWFGAPVVQQTRLLPGFAPTGSLVASASDMARCLQMLLAGGDAPAGRVLSPQGVAQLVTPGSPPARSTLLSAEFVFRYGEGWFVGPFRCRGRCALAPRQPGFVRCVDGAVARVEAGDRDADQCQHRVAVRRGHAVMSRLPIGVVNLLRGHAAPQGPSLREAYRPLNAAAAVALVALAALAWWARRARAAWPSVSLAVVAAALLALLYATGLRPALLAAFAPDLSVVPAATAALLCWPLAWHMGRAVIRRAAPP